MNDERERPPGQITPMEAVAGSGVSEDPERADPWSAGQPDHSAFSRSALDGIPPPIDIRGHCQAGINDARASRTDQIGIIMPEAPPAWVPEIRPPNRDEVVISVEPRGGRGLRVVSGALVAALGLG
jgi:hypothetical protein